MCGSALKPVHEDDHAGVAVVIAPVALGDEVPQVGHSRPGAVLLDEALRLVLASPTAFVAFHTHERQRELAQAPGAPPDHWFSSTVNQKPTPLLIKFNVDKG
jgi:hypothetical protein